jgi:saxitoxin biosynthesis operon SxtJ-like protein
VAHRVPTRLTPADGRRFGLQVGLAFAALGGLAWWRGHLRSAAVFLVVGGVLVTGGLLVPGSLGPVYRGWMRLALAISKVTTPLIMGIIYLLVLTPTGLLLRLFGHRPLARDRSARSYWIRRSAPDGGRSELRRQF